MRCLKCGAELAEGSLFCEKCGASISDTVIWDTQPVWRECCPYCGRQVEADDLFCGFCGRRLPEAGTAAVRIAEEAEPKTPESVESNAEPDSPESIEPDADPEIPKDMESYAESDSPESMEPNAEPDSPENMELNAEPDSPGSTEQEAEPEIPKGRKPDAEPETPESKEPAAEPEAPKGVESDADVANREDSEAEPEKEKPHGPLNALSGLLKKAGWLSRFRYLVPVAAGLLLLALLTAFLHLFTGREPEETGQTKVLYYRDDELYLADLETDLPAELITASCLDTGAAPYSGMAAGDRISEDGSYLFYREEYDGSTYDLYRRPAAGDAEEEKLAVNVSSYEIVADHNVVFQKGESLYYGDGGEPVRLGRDVIFWKTNRAGDSVCWMERDGGNGNLCYLLRLEEGAEKVQLDRDVLDFYAGDDLSMFMSFKGGVLYRIDSAGTRERIAQNVASVESCNPDAEKVYYTVENPVRMAYTDVILDEGNGMTEDDWIKVSDRGQFEVPYRKLMYHSPEGDAEISDRCFPVRGIQNLSISEDGAFCLYVEGPRVEKLKADWTEIKDRLDGDDFGTRLLTLLFEDGEFSGLRLAAAGRTVNEYEEAGLPKDAADVIYDGGERIYLSLDSEDGGTRMLYEIPLTGRDAGERRLVDEEMDAYTFPRITEEGIYYIRNPKEFGGDLYWNGQEIAYDVCGVWQAGKWIAYSYDYDENGAGGADFSLALYRDEAKTVVGNGISFADFAPDGTVVMLADFDPLKGEGTLLYFDGTDTEILSERVTGFVPRNGSTQIP